MSEPFRDGMGAALARIDQLADENQDLREEVERLRAHAHTVKASTTDEHANDLADQTLRMLDQLEVLSQRRPAVPAPAANARAVESTDRDEHAAQNVLVAPGRRPLAAPLLPASPPAEAVSRARWIAACVGCFVLGFVAAFVVLWH